MCFDASSLTLQSKILPEVRRINDSIKVLKFFSHDLFFDKPENQAVNARSEGIMAMGCTNDAIKIIDYCSHYVNTFEGFKSYPTSFCYDEENESIWVGCLDGTIACFEYYHSSNSPIGLKNKGDKFIKANSRIK